METSSQENPTALADVLEELGSPELLDDEFTPRRKSWWKWPLGIALTVVLLGAAAAGAHKWTGRSEARAGPVSTTHTVQRGELVVTITEDGSLESAGNQDVKCEVSGGTTILWIIEDGKEVKEGTELVRLDASKLEESIGTQRIAYEKARAANIQAEKDYAAAKIAVQEYLEGTYRKDLQDAEAKEAIAQENLRSAQNGLDHSQRMFRKGYVTSLQLEAQQFAVERAKLELGTAQTVKDVLMRFTRPKMVQELESKRDAAEAKRNAEKASLELEEGKLRRQEGQLKKCVIRAPKAGMVVYANERMYYGDQQAEVKPGMAVREEQTILRLPDLSKMQVKVTVHESKVDQLRSGMRARIRVQDREFQGTVTTVANRPEAHWFSPAGKKYPAKVDIDGDPKDLRPGMTAEVEILVAHLADVISVPVAAIYEQEGQVFCFVKEGAAMVRRNLVLGQGNDKFVQVKEGLQAGAEVALNPRSLLGDAATQASKRTAVDVKKKFGDQKKASAEPAKAEGKPAGKPEAKPETKAEEKPAAKPESKPEDKPEDKPAAKPEGKPAAKPEGKPAAKPEGKPAAKPEGKPAAKPEGKPAAKPEK